MKHGSINLSRHFLLRHWLRHELKESQSSSVRPVLVCLELLIFIFWHQTLQDDFRSVIGSQVSLRSLCAYFIRQTEPKILRLVR